MIARLWRGWTNRANADAYEALLVKEIFPTILARRIAGFVDISLARRDLASEVEFLTIMLFESLDAVRAFAGDDYATAVVPDAARALLARFDPTSAHYHVVRNRVGTPDERRDDRI